MAEQARKIRDSAESVQKRYAQAEDSVKLDPLAWHLFQVCASRQIPIGERNIENVEVCATGALAKAQEEHASALAKAQAEQARRATQDAYDACTKTTQYQLFESSEDVNTARVFVAASEAGMVSVKQFESVSGVIDPRERQAASASLLDSQARLDKIFSDYRKHGGTAASPKAVQPMTNPCPG